MDSRWGVLTGVCLGVVVVAAGSWYLSRDTKPEDPDRVSVEKELAEVKTLMDGRRFEDALAKLDPLRDTYPDRVDLSFMAGLCLYQLSRYERARACLEPVARTKAYAAQCAFLLGTIWARIDRPREALPLLEIPLAGQEHAREEADRVIRLAECYMDLEQFQNTLDILHPLPPRPEVIRLRYKALVYLGKKEEAKALLGEVAEASKKDPRLASHLAYLRAGMLREAGDFDGALAEFAKIRKALAGSSASLLVLDRSELVVYLEAGRLEELKKAAETLAGKATGKIRGDALWYLAVAQLEEGKTDAAKKTASRFLEVVHRDYSPLRLERMMMRQLLGEVTVKDLRQEAALISKFRANEVYYFLALSTGDRAWAEQARKATPGRNSPFHAIQRLLSR